MKNFEIQVQTGTPIKVDELTIKPVSQSFSWIGKRAGVVWNRPYAIQVQDGEKTIQLPVVDLTRLALIFLWGITAFFSLLALRNQLKLRR